MTFRCKACLGTYPEKQLDGSTFVHICPPLSAPELKAAGLPIALAAAGVTYRKGHRDETAVFEMEKTARGDLVPKRIGIRAEGAGREKVAD